MPGWTFQQVMLLGSYFYPKWLKIGPAGLGSHFRKSVTFPFRRAAAVVSWTEVCVCVCVCLCIPVRISVCQCVSVCIYVFFPSCIYRWFVVNHLRWMREGLDLLEIWPWRDSEHLRRAKGWKGLQMTMLRVVVNDEAVVVVFCIF